MTNWSISPRRQPISLHRSAWTATWLICGVAFAIGILTRLTLLPMIFTMFVAFTTVHGGSVSGGELAFLYLVVFVLSWFAGAGKYSVDGFITDRLKSTD